MRKWIVFLFLTVITGAAPVFGQKIDSILSVYRLNNQPEKLHLHFDKDTYGPGETIWFKSYIMAGESLSDYSRNFYVDWYDEQGNLLKHASHPVFESSARGQFEIPAGYKGELLRIRAYTRWMLNFDTAFVYTRNIQIAGSDSVSKTAARLPSANIRFFPEGGDLVTGISSTIAFLVADQQGMPVKASGAIFNQKNELIDSFVTQHDGMGTFILEPVAGELYTTNWTDEFGLNHTSELPVAKASGIVLEAKIADEKALFAVKRNGNAGDAFKTLHVTATMNQQLLYNANINLANRKTAAGEILSGQMPTGVLQLTVFDANWIPVAERVLFVDNDQYRFSPSLNLVNKRLGKRARNSVEIFVPDTALSNLSVSITDASLSYDSSRTIYSDLLLAGEVKGYIHNPAYYFSNAGTEKQSRLDLVMLTHGWRRYKWEDIMQNKLPQLKYQMDSDYLQIKGRIFTGGQATIRSGQSITIIMQAKDSSKQYFRLSLKPDGTFNQRGIIFFDTAKVFYQLNGDKRLNEVASASFQSGLQVFPFPRTIKPLYKTGFYTEEMRNNNLLYAGIEKTRKYYFDSVHTLKEVVVYSKVKSPIEILDEKYTTGLFSAKNDYAFDLVNDSRATGATNVFYYLQNMIPGMSMSIPILGANGAEDANSNNVPGINWRDGTPDIFLNEMPSDAGAVMGIQMSDVAYIKVFRPPFMASAGSGASGAIAIYTKKSGDKIADVKGLNHAVMSGYSTYKEFYNPDYTYTQPKSPDTRTTLYWNPYVLTDKSSKTFRFDFFNNDFTKKFRVVLEGVNAAGKLARIEKIIE